MTGPRIEVTPVAPRGCDVCGMPVEDVSERFCGGDRCRGVLMPSEVTLYGAPPAI
jgi:hypothetical protein